MQSLSPVLFKMWLRIVTRMVRNICTWIISVTVRVRCGVHSLQTFLYLKNGVCVSVCVCVCMCVCACVHVCACMHVYACIHVCVCDQTCYLLMSQIGLKSTYEVIMLIEVIQILKLGSQKPCSSAPNHLRVTMTLSFHTTLVHRPG